MNEEKLLINYLGQCSIDYDREIPTGNISGRKFLNKEYPGIEGYEGPLSLSIDALAEDIQNQEITVIEAKQKFSDLKSIGQVLFYSDLFNIDRENVRSELIGRSANDLNLSDYQRYQYHVNQDDFFIAEPDGTIRISDYEYRPLLPIQKCHHKIVVGEIDPTDTLRLIICKNLGIQVVYRQNEQWLPFNYKKVEVDSSANRSQLQDWLEINAKQRLDSNEEDDLAEEFIELIPRVFSDYIGDDISLFKEIPIGGKLFRGVPLSCDLIVQGNNRWLIVEIKNSSTDRGIEDFERAFGQSLGYATLFSQEWGISQRRILPIIVQHPIPLMGEVYRREKFEDYQQMIQHGFANNNSPLIFGSEEVIDQS